MCRMFRHRRLCTRTFRHWDFYAPEVKTNLKKKNLLKKKVFFLNKILFQITVFFSKKIQFKNFFFVFKNVCFFPIKVFSEKKKKKFFKQKSFFHGCKVALTSHICYLTAVKKSFMIQVCYVTSKKFYLDWNINIFEAFHLTLVKRNLQNRERRKRSGYRIKPSSNWLKKDRWESIICVQYLSWERIVFVSRRLG